MSTRAAAIANALDILGTDLTKHASGDAHLRELAVLTAQAIEVHAYTRGIVSDGERVHYLYRSHRDEDTAAAREDELERRARAFLSELDMGDTPIVVRLLERATGPEWNAAQPHQRASNAGHAIIARTSVLRGDNRAAVLLEIADDLAPADEAFVLAHEARHAWQQIAAPEYRRHEHRTPPDRERDADAWAERAVQARGWQVPAWARSRDLSSYQP